MTTAEGDETLWFAGKHVLITGAAGFIGARIVRQLRGVDCTITRLLRTPAPPGPPALARIEDIVADVRDDALPGLLPSGLDVVIHLAGQTSTYEANRDPRSDLQHNVLPVAAMLQCFKVRVRCSVFLYASTATVCGLPQSLPVGDDISDRPVSIYDLHKQMAEQYVQYFVREGVVTGASLRLANVYGPGPRSSRADRGILNQMVGRALRAEPLTVYGSGQQIRDYVHVDDVARAFLAAAAHAAELRGTHYVIGSGTGHSIVQALSLVAQRVNARTGRTAAVTHVDPPTGLSPIEARNFVADSRGFSRVTGWRPSFDLASGIDTIIDELL